MPTSNLARLAAGGFALGVGAAGVLTDAFDWPMVISPGAILIAIGCAAGIGVIFGFYPAWRVSALDPIDALRTE